MNSSYTQEHATGRKNSCSTNFHPLFPSQLCEETSLCLYICSCPKENQQFDLKAPHGLISPCSSSWTVKTVETVHTAWMWVSCAVVTYFPVRSTVPSLLPIACGCSLVGITALQLPASKMILLRGKNCFN